MHNYDKKNNPFKKIGKICVYCDSVREPSEFFLSSKKEIEKNKKREQEYKIKTKSKPRFSGQIICSECGAKNKIKITKHQERLHIEFDKERGELVCHQNNPQKECKCIKCGNHWTSSLQMPNEPKYELPKQMTKEKLRLAFLRVGSYKIKIPQRLKKTAMEIHRELKQEREAKEARDLEELLKRKA